MAHYNSVVERLRGKASPEDLAALIASHPDPLSPDARAAAEAKAADLIDRYAGPEPFSFQRMIDDIERALAKGPAGGLEPNTPDLWRAVVEVLHERQWQAFDADRCGAETPWDALDCEDFAYAVEEAKDLPADDPYRQSLDMEIARQAAAGWGDFADRLAREPANASVANA